MTKKTLLTFILFIACSFIAIGESISKNFLIGKWEATEGETWTFSANEFKRDCGWFHGWYTARWEIIDDNNLKFTIIDARWYGSWYDERGKTYVYPLKKMSNNEVLITRNYGYTDLIRK